MAVRRSGRFSYAPHREARREIARQIQELVRAGVG